MGYPPLDHKDHRSDMGLHSARTGRTAPRKPPRPLRSAAVLASALVAALGSVTTGAWSPPASAASRAQVVQAVGAENEYADVISQIGGRRVHVTAIMSNPSVDPHSFEASARVAKAISSAQLVVQNGLGYDQFMNKIESASPSAGRKVITVQALRHLPNGTPNPHLWYSPQTMPLVAKAVASDLASLQPGSSSYFEANATRFIRSLAPWKRAIAQFRVEYRGAPVATTEPVGDYLLQALGTVDLTPFGLQADIMNGTDPSPQDVSLQADLFSHHKVKVLVYNQQVADSLTQSFLGKAKKAGIPVVGVYETMPAPGFTYQSWMVAEVDALRKAVTGNLSTVKL